MLDIKKPVKLRNPQKGEEDVIYIVANFNEVTRRVYIQPVNLDLNLPSQELVSIDDIENVSDKCDF